MLLTLRCLLGGLGGRRCCGFRVAVEASTTVAAQKTCTAGRGICTAGDRGHVQAQRGTRDLRGVFGAFTFTVDASSAMVDLVGDACWSLWPLRSLRRRAPAGSPRRPAPCTLFPSPDTREFHLDPDTNLVPSTVIPYSVPPLVVALIPSGEGRGLELRAGV